MEGAHLAGSVKLQRICTYQINLGTHLCPEHCRGMKHLGPILLRFSIQQQQQNINARSRNEILQHVVVLMLRPKQLAMKPSSIHMNYGFQFFQKGQQPHLYAHSAAENTFTAVQCIHHATLLVFRLFSIIQELSFIHVPFCTGSYPTMNKYIEFFSHYQIWSPRVGSTPYTPIFSQNAKLGPGIILAPTAREKRTKRKSTKSKNST